MSRSRGLLLALLLAATPAGAADFLGIPIPDPLGILPDGPPVLYRGPRPVYGPPYAEVIQAPLPPPPGSLTCKIIAIEQRDITLRVSRVDLLGQTFRVTRASATHAERPDGGVAFDVVVMQVETLRGEVFHVVHASGLPWFDIVTSYVPGELAPNQLRWGSRDRAAMNSPAATLGERITSGPLLNITLEPHC